MFLKTSEGSLRRQRGTLKTEDTCAIPVDGVGVAAGGAASGCLLPRVERLTVYISAVGCAGDELQPCYYRKLHHQTSLSFRRERVYDVEGGLFAAS